MKNNIVLISFFVLIIIFPIVTSDSYDLIYDANGNLIKGFNNYYEYNDYNELEYVKENNQSGKIIAQYYYSPEGTRLKKVRHLDNGDNITTYYINENYIQVVNQSKSLNYTYYYDEEVLIAEKDSYNTKLFFHQDHIKSTSLVTNQSGDIIDEVFYLPYGHIIEGGKSRYLFTGKEKDEETGLYYFGARYYSPFVRRFIQPDSLIPDLYNPQDLNRYAYARNNPYKYNDPSGNEGGGGGVGQGVTVVGALTQFVVGIGIDVIDQILNGASIFEGTVDYSKALNSGGSFPGMPSRGGIFGAKSSSIAEATSSSDYVIGSQNSEATKGAVYSIFGFESGQIKSSLSKGPSITNNMFNPKGEVLAGAGGVLGGTSEEVGSFKGQSTLGGVTSVNGESTVGKSIYLASNPSYVGPRQANFIRISGRNRFASGVDLQSFSREVINKGKLSVQPDGSLRFDANLGRVVGIDGETGGTVIIDPKTGEIISQYPQKIR